MITKCGKFLYNDDIPYKLTERPKDVESTYEVY